MSWRANAVVVGGQQARVACRSCVAAESPGPQEPGSCRGRREAAAPGAAAAVRLPRPRGRVSGARTRRFALRGR